MLQLHYACFKLNLCFVIHGGSIVTTFSTGHADSPKLQIDKCKIYSGYLQLPGSP